jgi:hypothetical protein
MTGLNPDRLQRAIDVGMFPNHAKRIEAGLLPPSNAPKDRARNKRVEIDATEYKLLRRIAGIAVALYPSIEKTAIPVGRPKEFEEFRLLLKQYVDTRSVEGSNAETIVGLTDMLKDLS